MAEFKIARIEPARVSPGRADWDQNRRNPRQDARNRRPGAHRNLVASLFPNRDPETCEIDYAVNTEGDLVAVIVRDARTGVVLARVPAGDLASLGGPQASAGLLFERRG